MNRILTLPLRFILILTLAPFSANTQAAQVLLVDFNNPGGTTQSSWSSFNTTSDTSANASTQNYSGFDELAGVGNDITINPTGVEFARAFGTTTTGTGLDNMYRDLILRNEAIGTPPAGAGTIEIGIGGLLAGTYQITTHHYAANANNTNAFFDYKVTDSNSAGFSQIVGNYQMGYNNNVTVVTFQVEANGADDVVLQLQASQVTGGGNLDWIGFNGLEVAAIPEPSSLGVLCGLGGLLVLRRRRSR